MLLAATLLWVGAFITPVAMEPERYFSPIYGLVYSLLASTPRLASAVALLIVIFEAIWLNIILFNNKLNKVNWLMPALMFILVISWQSRNLTITPMLLAWLPLLAAMRQLLSSGNTSLGVDHNFNASFLIGIAALCYLPLTVFVIPFFFLFISYKSYHWRDFIVALMGLGGPLFLLVVYAFLCDKLDYYFILYCHDIINIHIAFNLNSTADIVSNVVFFIILFWVLFSQLFSINDSTIQQRINTVVLLLPLVAALLILPYDTLFTVNTQFTAVPFAFLSSNFLATDHKRRWINDTLFVILLLTPIASNIIN